MKQAWRLLTLLCLLGTLLALPVLQGCAPATVTSDPVTLEEPDEEEEDEGTDQELSGDLH